MPRPTNPFRPSERDATAHRLLARREKAWDLTTRGWTQAQIAKELGVGIATISLDLKAFREAMPPEDRESIKARHLAHLDRILRELDELSRKDGAPVTAGKDGDVVRDPATGDVVRDYGLRRQTLIDQVKVLERSARLFGLDDPVVVTHTGSVDTGSVDAQIAELAAELALNDAPVEPKAVVDPAGLSAGETE